MATTRRVAHALRPGGPEVIELKTEELHAPGPGEVLVRVAAAGLNHAETLIRSGTYTVRLPFPFATGGEGAGVVVEAGPGTSLAPGARVCWAAVLGSCADYLIAPAAMLVPLPDALSFEEGASVAVAGLTAGGLARVWPLEGKTAVIWGAAGAVGRMLVALLTERGAEVIGVASGNRVESVRAAGAAYVVDRTAGDVAEAVLAHTGGRGAAAVYDPIGEPTRDASLRMLGARGCLINYGELSGTPPALDLHQLFAKSLFVTKYNGMRWLNGPQEFGGLVAQGLALAERRRAVVSETGGRFPLSRVSDAYRAMESGVPGKVLVLPDA